MKTLAVISLTAFLCCCGVQSAELRDLEQQILNSGTVVFLDFLEKVRCATEKLIRDDQFKKSRITFQGYVKALGVLARSMKNPDSAGESQANSDIPLQFFSVAAVTLRQMTRDVFDRFLFPYINIYHEALKKETIKDIWKEVDSYYLPGAPPISSKPMEFFSYLLAKAVVRSWMLNVVQVGVNTIEHIGKTDFNQLNEEKKVFIHQIRKKASEISVLEKQNEKNDFLVSLRSISGLVVFYWDKVLEHTESPSFQEKINDSLMQWNKLTQFSNTGEKYHVLLSPETWREFTRWIEHNFDEYLNAASQIYVGLGVQVLGFQRCFQSTRAVGKSAVVFSLSVYEKLSEVGFGFTEINRFFNRANDITLTFFEGIEYSDRITPLNEIISLIFFRALEIIEDERMKAKNIPQSLPLRRYFPVCWKTLLMVENSRHIDMTETELKQMESVWNDAKRVIINELVKSNTFTRKQLEEAPNNFVQVVRWILEQLKQRTDLADGYDELIDPTIVALKRSMHRTNIMLREFWDLLLE